MVKSASHSISQNKLVIQMNYKTDEIYQRLVDVIADKLSVGPEEVTLDSHLTDDLGADSLDLVELIMEVEDKYKIEVDDETSEDLYTVGRIYEFLKANV